MLLKDIQAKLDGKARVKKIIHKEVFILRLDNGCKVYFGFKNDKLSIKRVTGKDTAKIEETQKLLGIYKKPLTSKNK